MVSLEMELQMALVVEWKVCLFRTFEEMSFRTSVWSETFWAFSASGSRRRSSHDKASVCAMIWSMFG